jgi:hypothetical protein
MAGTGIPFDERGGRLRGVLDLAAGRYPQFVFGGGLGTYLPVFHFHEVTASELEPKLTYLAENGYRTVVSDDIATLALGGKHPGPRSVALAFDDAHATFWTVAAPLLKRFGFRAILYAIPARVEEATAVRPTLELDPSLASAVPAGPRYATWPELRALNDSGVADIQSHTWSHSMIFTEARLVDFVGPDYGGTIPLNRPLVSDAPLAWAEPEALGTPIYAHRSRMADGLRFVPDAEAVTRCRQAVGSGGGAAFFARSDWKRTLESVAGTGGHYETPGDRERAILEELDRSRATLCERLRTTSVRHICLPWGVAGTVTLEALRRTGYETAFSNQLAGAFAVSAGDPPYRLKRLSNRFIAHLPGATRSCFSGWMGR